MSAFAVLSSGDEYVADHVIGPFPDAAAVDAWLDGVTDFAPDAGQVQAVVNALTSALSGLGNLMQSLGAQHGQSYASAFVAAVQAGLAQGLAPSAPGATPAPLPPAPGQGGGTVVNNYFTLNQYGVGAATAGAAAASFMGMKATIGAAP